MSADSGKMNWMFATKGVIFSSPLVSGGNIYFTSYDRNCYCLEGATGKKLWDYEMEGKGRTAPVIWDNFIFFADEVNNLYCFTDKPIPKVEKN